LLSILVSGFSQQHWFWHCNFHSLYNTSSKCQFEVVLQRNNATNERLEKEPTNSEFLALEYQYRKKGTLPFFVWVIFWSECSIRTVHQTNIHILIFDSICLFHCLFINSKIQFLFILKLKTLKKYSFPKTKLFQHWSLLLHLGNNLAYRAGMDLMYFSSMLLTSCQEHIKTFSYKHTPY